VGEAIGAVLGNAAGVAVGPVQVIAAVMILLSKASTRNSVAFSCGWLLGLSAVGLAVLALDVASGAGEGERGLLQVLLGAGLLVLAWRKWRSRPAEGEAPEPPAWMATIVDLSAPRAVGLGLLLSVPNPKVLAITAAATTSIAGADLPPGQELATLGVFVALASITVIGPVVAHLVAPDRSQPALGAIEAFLTENATTLVAVVLVVLGAKVLGDGITNLA
jgi:hypothetical protein